MTPMIWMYLIYVVLCVGITIWVARTLKTHGPVFVTDGSEDGHTPVVKAMTHLLVVGFYLINFGIISFALKHSESIVDVRGAIEALGTKVGTIVVGIGCMHFVLLAIFSGMRRNPDNRSRRDNVHSVSRLSEVKGF